MLEHPAAAKFRTHVMNGEWEKVSTHAYTEHTHIHRAHTHTQNTHTYTRTHTHTHK